VDAAISDGLSEISFFQVEFAALLETVVLVKESGLILGAIPLLWNASALRSIRLFDWTQRGHFGLTGAGVPIWGLATSHSLSRILPKQYV
jgi:hypothetical protein